MTFNTSIFWHSKQDIPGVIVWNTKFCSHKQICLFNRKFQYNAIVGFVVCADYLIIFWDLLTFFFSFFFQKQSSKDRLSQENLLKRTLLNKKQSNLEKEMYENIYLYSPYFSPGAGSNVHKTYFYFLKLTKKYFILSY